MTSLVHCEPESDFALLSVTASASDPNAEEDVCVPPVKYFPNAED